MARKLSEAQKAQPVLREVTERPDWSESMKIEFPDKGSVRDFLKSSPVRVGDLIRFKAAYGYSRQGLVVCVHSDLEWFQWKGYRLHMYRVRPLRKSDGKPSNNFIYVWPGQIGRGYKESN